MDPNADYNRQYAQWYAQWYAQSMASGGYPMNGAYPNVPMPPPPHPANTSGKGGVPHPITPTPPFKRYLILILIYLSPLTTRRY